MQNKQIEKEAEALYPAMVKHRQRFHKNPELSEQEYQTQAYIMENLEKMGIPSVKCAETGVVALIQGRTGKNTVALRADMDALPITEINDAAYCSVHPGVMHACGHDAHTAIALGCAQFFQEHRELFEGNVKILFQPAEETIGGASRMIQEGCLKNPDVDYCVGLHVMPYLPYYQIEIKYGPLNASTDDFTLIVRGKSAHGASPNKGADAVVIASHIIVMLQSIVSRMISPIESGVITIGKISGGLKSNIIADQVKLEGTIRASGSEMRAMLLREVKNIAQSVALSMGGDTEFIQNEGSYIPLVNDSGVLDVVKAAGVELLGRENVVRKETISMGGEDFSFFNEQIPGAFYHIGCGDGNGWRHSLHTERFDIDERCLKTGFKVNVLTILKLLAQP